MTLPPSPKRPPKEEVYTASVWDFKFREGTYEDPADADEAKRYNHHLGRLRGEYGENNVSVAYATEALQQRYGISPNYDVVMVRLPFLKDLVFERLRQELTRPLTVEESRLTLNAVKRTSQALKQIFH